MFGFHRNDVFDAHNYFDSHDRPVPPLLQTQFGGALGGPAIKDRSFFFASYEGLRMNRSLTQTFSVPSASVRGGNFAGLEPICDPLTISTTGRCVPFPDNQIPANRIDPIATALLEHVPLPKSDAALQNLTAVEESVRHIDQFSLRLDHRLTSNDNIFARFSTFGANRRSAVRHQRAAGSAAIPGVRPQPHHHDPERRGESHAPVRTRVAQRISNRLDERGGRPDERESRRGLRRSGGVAGRHRDPRDVGFPQISTRGLYSTMGNPTSFVFRENRHLELYDNVTLDRGAHRIKFGAYFFHLRLRPEQPDSARGAFTYTGQFTGNALADFLLGYPTSATSGSGRGNEDGRTNWLHVYAQDDWRMRDNLTVNVGLRYEYRPAHVGREQSVVLD